jgi:tRNA-(ms[2]io[6]A)-hydroxylase
MGVLRLKLPTDPRWVNIVEKTSRKSDGSCLVRTKSGNKCDYDITNNSEHQIWFKDLLALAKEEIDHFEVHNIIIKSG